MKNINDHFGWAKQFAVYEIDEKEFRPLDAICVEMGDGDDKLNPKIAALSGCAIVFSSQIGPQAAARLVKNRIHPMKGEEPIEEVLKRLLSALQCSPSPWLKKILNREKGE